jgi:hypothetical protein
VRLVPTFLVASGRESAPDRVIAERERFTIGEKTGEEGASSRGRPPVNGS